MRCGKTETPGSVRGFQVIGLAGVGLSACLDPVHRHSPDARGAFGFDGFFGLGVAHGRVSVRGCRSEASWVSAVRAEGHEAWTRNGVEANGEVAERDSNLTGITRRIRHLSSETAPVLGRLTANRAAPPRRPEPPYRPPPAPPPQPTLHADPERDQEARYSRFTLNGRQHSLRGRPADGALRGMGATFVWMRDRS